MARSIASKNVRVGAAAVLTASYLCLVLLWFDHDLKSAVPAIPPLAPALTGLISLVVLLKQTGRPKLFSERADLLLLVALAGASMIIRLPFVGTAYGLFSSDAAVQGIMALHILEGRHHPVFLYGWSYVGSPKAHLTAALTWLTDEPVVSFVLAAVLVYGLFTAAVFLLARATLPRREAVVAALYVVVAPGFLTAWGIHNEGSYLDVAALGTLMLWVAVRLTSDREHRVRRAFWLALLGGLAFWIHILATYYLLMVLVVLIFVGADRGRRVFARWGAFAAGFSLGYFPGLLWNVTHDWLSFRWWTIDETEAADRVGRTVSQLKEVVTTALPILAGWWPADARPAPERVWYGALALGVPLTAALFAWRKRADLRELGRGRLTSAAILLGFFLLVTAVFSVSSFGWLTEEPRYLLFLFSVLPIFVASLLGFVAARSRVAAGLACAGLLYLHLHGSLVYFERARESDSTNRHFLAEVERLGIRYAHTDYHISYKYNFMSHGRLVWTSALGPSQTEWYLPYREEVTRADHVALIPRSYRFARRIGRRLDGLGVSYRREDLLYPILYDLSEPVPLERLR